MRGATAQPKFFDNLKPSKGDIDNVNKTLSNNLQGVPASGYGKLQVIESGLVSQEGTYSGRGLRATTKFKKGDIICSYVGKFVTVEQASASFSDYILLKCDASDCLKLSYGPFIQVKLYFFYNYSLLIIFFLALRLSKMHECQTEDHFAQPQRGLRCEEAICPKNERSSNRRRYGYSF